MLPAERCHPSSRVLDLINLWPATSPTTGSSRGRRSCGCAPDKFLSVGLHVLALEPKVAMAAAPL